MLNWGCNLGQLQYQIWIQVLPLSYQSSAPKYKWSVSGQIMTAWCFWMLWNTVFETSVHIWKYHVSFISLCSSFLLIIFTFSAFCRHSLVKLSHCPLLLPPFLPAFLLPFLFSLPCQICIFEQWIKSHTENVIFFFNLKGKHGEELIWSKLVSPTAVDFLLGAEERREASLAVRVTSQSRDYFHFINNKVELQWD